MAEQAPVRVFIAVRVTSAHPIRGDGVHVQAVNGHDQLEANIATLDVMMQAGTEIAAGWVGKGELVFTPPEVP